MVDVLLHCRSMRMQRTNTVFVGGGFKKTQIFGDEFGLKIVSTDDEEALIIRPPLEGILDALLLTRFFINFLSLLF